MAPSMRRARAQGATRLRPRATRPWYPRAGDSVARRSPTLQHCHLLPSPSSSSAIASAAAKCYAASRRIPLCRSDYYGEAAERRTMPMIVLLARPVYLSTTESDELEGDGRDSPQNCRIPRNLARRRTPPPLAGLGSRSEEHTSELQSRQYLVCRLLL